MALDTPLRTVKYLNNIIKSTPHSGHKKITKPDSEAKQSVVSLQSSTEASRRLTSWNMLILFPREIRGKLVNKFNSESTKEYPKGCGNNLWY